jgi:hypothetical protein
MGYNLHGFLGKKLFIIKKTEEFKKSFFGYDLKLLSFKKMKD